MKNVNFILFIRQNLSKYTLNKYIGNILLSVFLFAFLSVTAGLSIFNEILQEFRNDYSFINAVFI